MKRTWQTYAFWIALTELTGALSGWLTRAGTERFQASVRQPPLSPPGIVFPIVWAVLFALMGAGAARVWLAPPSPQRTAAMRWFGAQLVFNFFWSILFFNFQAYGPALFWLIALWCLILGMLLAFRAVDRTAGRLQIPYLLWVTFAAYLNLGVWLLNRQPPA